MPTVVATVDYQSEPQSLFAVGEPVSALWEGEWHQATIASIDSPGLYSVQWETAVGRPITTPNYCESELVSRSWRTWACKSDAEFEKERVDFMNKVNDILDKELETGSEMSLTDEFSFGDGIAAAEQILGWHEEYKTQEKKDAEWKGWKVIDKFRDMWMVPRKKTVPYYNEPKIEAVTDIYLESGAVIIALNMYEIEGNIWIKDSTNRWLLQKGAAGKEHLQLPPSVQDEKWEFAECGNVALLASRVIDRKVRGMLNEEPLKTRQPSLYLQRWKCEKLNTLARFFPGCDLGNDIDLVCTLSRVIPGSDFDSTVDACLQYAMTQLWKDIKLDMTQQLKNHLFAKPKLAKLRFLFANRFLTEDPVFLTAIIATGRYDVGKYLYEVGPEFTKSNMVAVQNGFRQLLKGARTNTIYKNVQHFIKFGSIGFMDVSKIIKSWDLMKGIKWSWDSSRALKTFRAYAKNHRNSANRLRKRRMLQLCARKNGLCDNLTELINEYVHDFNVYVVPDQVPKCIETQEDEAEQ